jgi:hypothetical protein
VVVHTDDFGHFVFGMAYEIRRHSMALTGSLHGRDTPIVFFDFSLGHDGDPDTIR